MEGDLSKHGSTESVISSMSHYVSATDHLFDISLQINDCLKATDHILNQQYHFANKITAFNREIQRMEAQARARKLQIGFKKSVISGTVDYEGQFVKRQYTPIIIKQIN